MDNVVNLLVWLRSVWSYLVDNFYSANWFFGCLIVFPFIRYFFRKFFKSF